MKFLPMAVTSIVMLVSMVAFAENPSVRMTVERRGEILIELLPGAAPKTVAHFTGLVKKKFYDGILFHRVVPGFVAQAGNAQTKTKGLDVSEEVGSGKTITLEPPISPYSHVRGTLGMARTSDLNSGDSQFFFNLGDNSRLDTYNGGYTMFGRVVKGMEVVSAIQMGDKITRAVMVEKPVKPVLKQPVKKPSKKVTR